jgi:O-antigen ligase
MWSYPMQTGFMEVVNHPHNAFLEAVLDMGFVGLALLCAFYLHAWRGMRSLGSNAYLTPELRALFQGGCAALIAFGFTCMTGGSLRPEPENAFVWFAIGMMYGVLARKPAA